ncbi:MAG: hypothetical protein ACD_63C00029G0001 [uncultured bacterium]|nr:MAG: hypothetical protein ACD_63C00029G0001 [uncultured bacterium]
MVGKKTEQHLAKLGILKVRDLLFHFPSYHQDLSKITKIQNVKPNNFYTIKGKLISIVNKRTPRKFISITEALLTDETASLKIVWFNQPFLKKSLRMGQELLASGKAQIGMNGLQLTSPTYEIFKKELTHTGRIVPVYSTTGKLTPKLLRFLIKKILPKAKSIKDYLPKDLKKRQGFTDLNAALQQIHFPDNEIKLKQAKRRLAFDELFFIQLSALSSKRKLQEHKAPQIKFDKKLVQSFVRSLPFELTNAQRRAAWEVLKNIEKSTPMNRLLEGDVGSGKTLVAAINMLEVAKAKMQSVIMSPTEVLAVQHFKNLSKLFTKQGIIIGLLTNNYSKANKNFSKEKNKIKTMEDNLPKTKFKHLLEKGKIDLIVGTHALIQKNIRFANLALVVIDEQHRFGVNQRKSLKDKTPKLIPHFLSMTATPIPRTLAISLYGDLDISILDEMPKNRKPIKTYLVPSTKRIGAYDFIKKEIKNGRQAFVICPLIEKSDKLGVKSATWEYKKLKKGEFKNLRINLLHGRMKAKEKEKTMDNFKSGKIDVLVSTAVVEVGVDVPKASVMMIEGSERFGLAQLHQFRGRVGRSKYQSYCFLFTDSPSQQTKERLAALVKSSNGFKLAEYDLAQRGPGEVYGIQQSGIPDLRMASLTDLVLIKTARAEAQVLINNGLEKHPALEKKLNAFSKKVHWE